MTATAGGSSNVQCINFDGVFLAGFPTDNDHVSKTVHNQCDNVDGDVDRGGSSTVYSQCDNIDGVWGAWLPTDNDHVSRTVHNQCDNIDAGVLTGFHSDNDHVSSTVYNQCDNIDGMRFLAAYGGERARGEAA